MAGITLCDVFESNEIVQFRPPASSSPVARMAPNLAMVSSCLSAITLASSLRCSVSRDASEWSAFCMSTIEVPISAPWRT
jgi:hypothetical protein